MEVEQTFKIDKFRGKLYSLTPESEWKDVGTGFVRLVEKDDPPGLRHLVFHEESEGKVLHDRPVAGEGTYQLQGAGERQTIIVWEDPQSHQDFAISFQEFTGTMEIWQALSKPPAQPENRLLPLPTLANLGALSRHLMQVPPSQREGLAGECITPNFLNALRETFHTVEDLGQEDQLRDIWLIAKGIFLLSNQKLTERYLRSDVYEDIMGMLEYDDGLPLDKRLPHRQVLKVKVRFNDVISFESQDVVERIHLNYRLQYLKDIVLPRLLDDGSFVALTQMIHTNLAAILDHLQSNKQLMQRLFQQIKQQDLQSLAFLQDVCRLAKILPPSERAALYDKFLQEKLFEVLIPFLSCSAKDEPSNPRHCAVEVLLLAVLHDPAHLRAFLTSSRDRSMKEHQDGVRPGRILLSELIRLMLTEVDQGVQSQIAELLKFVMDPSTLEFRERDTALDVFYEDGALDELVRPLREALPSRGPMRFSHQLICELVAFAVTNHGYRARVYIARHGLGQQIVRLFADEKNRSLQLAPIRLLKAMVASKDDAYHRYLTKHGLFAPLMRSFQFSVTPPALGGNLLVSATLDLLELIRLENFKALVDHICTKHGPMLEEHVPKFKTLEMFFLRHQQNLEYEAFPPDQHSSGGPMQRVGRQQTKPARARSPGREDSDDDEAYFESEDDEQVAENPQAGGTDVQVASSQQPKATGQVIEGSQSLPTATTTVTDAPLGNQDSGQPALKELLLGYDDDDDDDHTPPVPPTSPEAAVDDASTSAETQGTGFEIETDEAKTEKLRAEAAVAAAAAAAAVAGSNVGSDDIETTNEVKEVTLEESATLMTPVGEEPIEESSKPIEEEELRSAEASQPSSEIGSEIAEDLARAPSAKAKAETRSLNHVVKRMKVN